MTPDEIRKLADEFDAGHWCPENFKHMHGAVCPGCHKQASLLRALADVVEHLDKQGHRGCNERCELCPALARVEALKP